ncbi:DegT/DnrJ/EryC1/StrS family aminotransferase [Alkalilimnicola ehrlichii]|uniref:DegT/DnrJ/EryC1/StrS family aminotransferase n=1 Tax=Alkalilimnicola ehrlichii TaxID=351052 RepID=UPI0015F27A5B|nr:DegT/DnrJ/EryC1/StrS family aminotransferase [Alkalilimnicola ehrlichii]
MTLRRRKAPSLATVCAPWRVDYFQSGTASLAAALEAAARRKSCREPEVLVPAYGCPDLISAALFAGVKPVLVDFVTDRPWLDLDGVAEKITERTVAVVAVPLLGLPERSAELRALAHAENALLIEDCAQCFPFGQGVAPQGDYVILSFGRGKPVSLLGGGAVLSATEALAGYLPQPVSANGGWLSFWGKSLLYNGLRNPRCYWLPQSLPALGIGETRFEPLLSLKGMDIPRRSLLATNLQLYRRRPALAQGLFDAMLTRLDASGVKGGLALLEESGGKKARLLRYPLLFDERLLRDEAHAAIQRLGLGSSCLYGRILPDIAGVAPHLHRCSGAYPRAASFAARLLTLPVHSDVRTDVVEQTEAILRTVLELGVSAIKLPPIRVKEGEA